MSTPKLKKALIEFNEKISNLSQSQNDKELEKRLREDIKYFAQLNIETFTSEESKDFAAYWIVTLLLKHPELYKDEKFKNDTHGFIREIEKLIRSEKENKLNLSDSPTAPEFTKKSRS